MSFSPLAQRGGLSEASGDLPVDLGGLLSDDRCWRIYGEVAVAAGLGQRQEEGARRDLASQPRGAGKAGPDVGHGKRDREEPPTETSEDGPPVSRCRGKRAKQATGHLVTPEGLGQAKGGRLRRQREPASPGSSQGH